MYAAVEAATEITEKKEAFLLQEKKFKLIDSMLSYINSLANEYITP